MASKAPRLKRLLVQLAPNTLKELRREQRRTGAASRAETIRALINDGFALRYAELDDDQPAARDSA